MSARRRPAQAATWTRAHSARRNGNRPSQRTPRFAPRPALRERRRPGGHQQRLLAGAQPCVRAGRAIRSGIAGTELAGMAWIQRPHSGRCRGARGIHQRNQQKHHEGRRQHRADHRSCCRCRFGSVHRQSFSSSANRSTPARSPKSKPEMGRKLRPGSVWRHDLCQASANFRGGRRSSIRVDTFRGRTIDTFMTCVTVSLGALRYVGHRSDLRRRSCDGKVADIDRAMRLHARHAIRRPDVHDSRGTNDQVLS